MTLNRKTGNEEGWTIDERLEGETFLDAANRLKSERGGNQQSSDEHDSTVSHPSPRTDTEATCTCGSHPHADPEWFDHAKTCPWWIAQQSTGGDGDAQSGDAYDSAIPVPVDRTHRTPCVEGSICGIPEAHCPPA